LSTSPSTIKSTNRTTTTINPTVHTINTTYWATTGSLNIDWATRHKAETANSKTNLKTLLCVLIRPTSETTFLCEMYLGLFWCNFVIFGTLFYSVLLSSTWIFFNIWIAWVNKFSLYLNEYWSPILELWLEFVLLCLAGCLTKIWTQLYFALLIVGLSYKIMDCITQKFTKIGTALNIFNLK